MVVLGISLSKYWISLMAQFRVVASKLTTTYWHGDAWICIRVFREIQQGVATACFGCAKLLLSVCSSSWWWSVWLMPWEVVEAMLSVILVEGCNMMSCMSFLILVVY